MKFVKQLSIILLLPLFCNMIVQPKTPLNAPKLGFFEKKWVQKIEKRAQQFLEKKGFKLNETDTTRDKKSNTVLVLGVSSAVLTVLSFFAVTDDGSGRKADWISAVGFLGFVVAFVASILAFVIGRKIKTRQAKTGKIFAGLNLLLVFLIGVFFYMVLTSGD